MVFFTIAFKIVCSKSDRCLPMFVYMLFVYIWLGNHILTNTPHVCMQLQQTIKTVLHNHAGDFMVYDIISLTVPLFSSSEVHDGVFS